jgi:hypothetical protein
VASESERFGSLADVSSRVDAVWGAIGRRDFEPALETLQRLDSDLRAIRAGA